jgi:hypothetical protein
MLLGRGDERTQRTQTLARREIGRLAAAPEHGEPVHVRCEPGNQRPDARLVDLAVAKRGRHDREQSAKSGHS